MWVMPTCTSAWLKPVHDSTSDFHCWKIRLRFCIGMIRPIPCHSLFDSSERATNT